LGLNKLIFTAINYLANKYNLERGHNQLLGAL